MYRKNVASQNLPFALVNASTGAALTGATVTARRSIDGGAQENATGTVSELANGQYNLALSQADTNGNNIGILLTATNAIPVHFTLVTTAADPTDSVRLGLTALPNAAAEAAGGLYTRGTGAGQINQPANGMVDVNQVRLGGSAQSTTDLKDFADDGYDPSTNKVQGVVLTDTVTTYTGNTPQTGDAFARLGAPNAGSVSADIAVLQADTDDIQTRLPATLSGGRMRSDAEAISGSAPASDAVEANIGNLDAAVSSRSSHSAADVWAVGSRTLTAFGFSVTVGTNNDKTGYSLSAAGIQAIWDALTSALTTVGSIGKLLVDNINATISSRSSHSAADVWASGTRTLTSFGTLVADVATAVWAAGARTLTAFGFSVTVGTNNDKTGYSLTSGERDSIADAFLDRDMSAGTDSGSTTVRTPRQALRPLRNKVDVGGATPGQIDVYKEDDATISWSAAMTTDPAAEPITLVNPAGGS